MTSKEKAKDALPLKGFVASKPVEPQLERAAATGDMPNLEDVIGMRKERRECAVGVRVTRKMKEVLENTSSKTRLSESEIVYRILQKNLNMER